MGTKFEVLLKSGEQPISFRQLMALKRRAGESFDTFESLTPAWPPAPFKRAFGGHVYAQAVYAASKTVDKGQVVHVCVPLSFLSKVVLLGRERGSIRATGHKLCKSNLADLDAMHHWRRNFSKSPVTSSCQVPLMSHMSTAYGESGTVACIA